MGSSQADGVSQSAFAQQLGFSFPRVNEVINARRSMTPDTALQIAQVTG
ncbi:MAG: helix-turn-helix domain-containing protein [Gemmatimonadaceae bacterium]|nr:helix-turn-helix domain-containing protein [Gemmatimonadaceae bacterium]